MQALSSTWYSGHQLLNAVRPADVRVRFDAPGQTEFWHFDAAAERSGPLAPREKSGKMPKLTEHEKTIVSPFTISQVGNFDAEHVRGADWANLREFPPIPGILRFRNQF